MRQPYSLLARKVFFIGFDAFRVRLEPYAGLRVHALTKEKLVSAKLDHWTGNLSKVVPQS